MIVVRTRPEWRSVVQKVKNSYDESGTRVISFDVETVDEEWPDVALVGFSVAWYDVNHRIEEAYVPVGHTTGEMQLSLNDVLGDLKEILEDESIELVMQNAKYEIKVCALLGICIHENIFDTMIASWLLNTNGVGTQKQILAGHGGHGLKDLSKYILGEEMTELTEIAKYERREKNGRVIRVLRTDQVPIDEMADYGAAGDARQTLRLREKFLPQLQDDPRVMKFFHAMEREFVHCLAEMEMWGVEIDVELLKDMREAVEAEQEEIHRRMFEVRPGHDFSPPKDPRLIGEAAKKYEELEQRFKLDKNDAGYPINPKTGKPWSKGSARKTLFELYNLSGTVFEHRIRDDALRPFIIRWPHLVHKMFNPNSNADLNKVLFDECYLTPIGERLKTGLWSTAAEHIDEWARGGNEMAKLLQRDREIGKLHGTYLVGMASMVGSDNRLRGSLNRIGTRTGRLSSSNPNLQNIPTSDEFPIRRAFVATGITEAEVVFEYEDEEVEEAKAA